MYERKKRNNGKTMQLFTYHIADFSLCLQKEVCDEDGGMIEYFTKQNKKQASFGQWVLEICSGIKNRLFILSFRIQILKKLKLEHIRSKEKKSINFGVYDDRHVSKHSRAINKIEMMHPQVICQNYYALKSQQFIQVNFKLNS